MRVEMTTRIGGYRNLEEWPEVGGTIVLPDHEAADLIAAGYAKEVPGEAGQDSSAEPAGAAPEAGPEADGDAEPDPPPAEVKSKRVTRKRT